MFELEPLKGENDFIEKIDIYVVRNKKSRIVFTKE